MNNSLSQALPCHGRPLKIQAQLNVSAWLVRPSAEAPRHGRCQLAMTRTTRPRNATRAARAPARTAGPRLRLTHARDRGVELAAVNKNPGAVIEKHQRDHRRRQSGALFILHMWLPAGRRGFGTVWPGILANDGAVADLRVRIRPLSRRVRLYVRELLRWPWPCSHTACHTCQWRRGSGPRVITAPALRKHGVQLDVFSMRHPPN